MKSLLFFQLIEKALTIFLHTANARTHRLSLTDFLTAKFKLYPKHDKRSQSKLLHANTILEPIVGSNSNLLS